jgi:putative N6-adenine-specific DNA methylase
MPVVDRSRFEIFASTAPGLESIAAGELKALGIRGRQEIGGVAFSGDLERVYQANLWLRTATRVTVRMARFHASTFFELERRARKLDWARFLPPSGEVRIRVTCRKSKLYHSDAVGERVLAAIGRSAARDISVGIAPSEDEESEEDSAGESPAATASDVPRKAPVRSQLFVVRIFHDECEISADASGELLHRRGYRQEVAKAPMRETIAAAMVLASGWKGRTPLVDPLCGSGTIPIEAAMIARNIAPGLSREFQFMHWPGFDSAKWSSVVDAAQSRITEFSGEIAGADRDAGAVAASARNAQRAGVADQIEFSQKALSASLSAVIASGRRDGWILTNPPYGMRVGSGRDLRDLYATLGSMLRDAPTWRLGVLTSDAALIRTSQVSPVCRFSTSNGGIPVGFWVTDNKGERTRA